MSPAIHANPKIPVGRPVSSAGSPRRPGEPPYRGEPPGLKPSEVKLLLFLGIGGAVCLLVLALVGFAFNKRGDRGAQPVVAKVDKKPEIFEQAVEEHVVVERPPVGHAFVEINVPVMPVQPDPKMAQAILGKPAAPVILPGPDIDIDIAPGPVAAKAQGGEPKKCQTCQKFGTTIEFIENPPDAFKKARAFGKQVFMVHLSGNFEDKEFT